MYVYRVSYKVFHTAIRYCVRYSSGCMYIYIYMKVVYICLQGIRQGITIF